jgi:hypothetical protein
MRTAPSTCTEKRTIRCGLESPFLARDILAAFLGNMTAEPMKKGIKI